MRDNPLSRPLSFDKGERGVRMEIVHMISSIVSIHSAFAEHSTIGCILCPGRRVNAKHLYRGERGEIKLLSGKTQNLPNSLMCEINFKLHSERTRNSRRKSNNQLMSMVNSCRERAKSGYLI